MSWSRASLVAFLLGLGIGGAQYYILHQDVWKSTENMLRMFSHHQIVKVEENIQSEETIENHLRKKAISWWNRSLDGLKDRLVRLPDSFHMLLQDTKAAVEKVSDKTK